MKGLIRHLRLFVMGLALSVTLAQGEPKLTGSELKADDLILKVDVIYGGKITSLGTLDNSTGQPIYRDVKIEFQTILRSFTPELMRISLSINLAHGEVAPTVGESYIVFLREDGNPNAISYSHPCPCTVIKLLPSTLATSAELHRLINLPANSHELPGSMVKLPEAAKAETIFVGTVLDISPYGDIAAAGGSHYWPRIKVTKVLRGWIDNPVSVQIFVMYNPHEEPPRKGSSYIFFVDKIPGWNLGRKLLPATEDAIKQVSAAIPPQSPSDNVFCGDDLKPETAMTKSDAIFTGTIQDIGKEDSGDSYSFAYPTRHVVGMKIAIDQVSRGDVKGTTTVTAFIQAIPPLTDQIRGPYIFYVRKNDKGDRDPFTVLKALPKTDANLLATQTLLIPPSSDVLCGSALTIEAAADKSDTVFVGAITELGPAFYHQPNVPAHLDTYPALLKPFEFISARHPATQDINQTTDHNYSEQPAREGSSYIFFMLGRTAIKILPATDENLAKARGIASRVVAHGAETKPPGYFNLGQIDSDQKALAASKNAQTKLPGSDQKTEDVIPKCNVAFEGQVLTVGSIGMEVGGLPGYYGNKVKVLQVFRGSVGPVATTLDYEAVDTSMELVPLVGDKCLFLAHKYTAAGGIDAGTIYLRTLKVLAATDDNIAKVKQLAATLPASDE
jgi:hypothetical protein